MMNSAPLPPIAAIRTTVFRLPMRGTLRWGKASSLNELRHVLVEVTLADGSQGVAEAPPRPTIYGETVESITGIIKHELAPRLIGQPPSNAHSRLHEVANNNTAKGAIDIALHDAVAQHRGETLLDHLAALHPLSSQDGRERQASQDRIRVSYILGIGDEETVLAEATRVYELGVRVLKVKVGRDWRADLRSIEAIQAALPDDLELYADANECLKAASAESQLTELKERGLLYCEEPLPVEQILERANLRKAEALSIIADDSCFTVHDLRRELALNTFDILNIKTPRTGYTESLQMLALAEKAGKGIMIGSQAGSGLGAARAALFAALPGIKHPSELSFFLKLEEEILVQPLSIVDGYMQVGDAEQAKIDPGRLRDVSVTE